MEKTYSVMLESKKGANFNHQEIARYMIDHYTLSSIDDSIFRYEEGIWIYVSKQRLQHTILKEINKFPSEGISKVKTFDINEILNFIVAKSYNEHLKAAINNPVEYEINFADQILNVYTKGIKSYSPQCNKLYKLDVNYFDTKSSTPPHRLLAFLNEILEGYVDKENIIALLQEYIGYLLVPITKYEKSLFLLGSGANGKSVLLNIIKGLLGAQNISSIGLQDLNREQSRFNLLGKIALIDSDLQQSVQLDSGIIKKITSGETIDGKPLYRQILEFKPLCKILCASNHKPYIKSIDNSIKRRFVFIHLKNSFIGRENPNLIQEILQEKAAIIGRAVQGLDRLLQRGHFNVPKELIKIVDNLVEENDSVKQFLNDLGDTTEHNNYKASYQKIYNAYKVFCKETGQKPYSMITINKRLRELGYEEYRTEKERGFIGVLSTPFSMTEGQNDNLFQNNSRNVG